MNTPTCQIMVRAEMMKVFYHDILIARQVNNKLVTVKRNGTGIWQKMDRGVKINSKLKKLVESPRASKKECPLYWICLDVHIANDYIWSNFSCLFCPTHREITNSDLIDLLEGLCLDTQSHKKLRGEINTEIKIFHIPEYTKKYTPKGGVIMSDKTENKKPELFEDGQIKIFHNGSLVAQLTKLNHANLVDEMPEDKVSRIKWYENQAKLTGCPLLPTCSLIAKYAGWKYYCCSLCIFPELFKAGENPNVESLNNLQNSDIQEKITNEEIVIISKISDPITIWPLKHPINNPFQPEKEKPSKGWSRLSKYVLQFEHEQEKPLGKMGRNSAKLKAQEESNSSGEKNFLFSENHFGKRKLVFAAYPSDDKSIIPAVRMEKPEPSAEAMPINLSRSAGSSDGPCNSIMDFIKLVIIETAAGIERAKNIENWQRNSSPDGNDPHLCVELCGFGINSLGILFPGQIRQRQSDNFGLGIIASLWCFKLIPEDVINYAKNQKRVLDEWRNSLLTG